MPGLETTLPLLLTAVTEGRLTMEKLIGLTSGNPAEIFGIRQNEAAYVEIDLQESYLIKNSDLQTKCGWSPFAGRRVRGRIKGLYLRGRKVFGGEKILVEPGYGRRVNASTS